MNSFESQLMDAFCAMDGKSVLCRRVTMVNGSYAIEKESSLVHVPSIERIAIGIRYGIAGHNVIGECMGQFYLLPVTQGAKDAIRKSVGILVKERNHGIYWCDMYLSPDDFISEKSGK